MHPFCRRYSLCRSRKGKYDSKISRVLIDLAKLNTLNRTTAAVCRELIKEITLVTYKIYDPDSLFTLKQQLPIIHKSIFIKCRPFYTDRNKTKKNANKKSVHTKLPIPKRRKSKLTGKVARWTNNLNIVLTEQIEFDVINAAKPFSQILNILSAHWISVANLKQSRAHDDCWVSLRQAQLWKHNSQSRRKSSK